MNETRLVKPTMDDNIITDLITAIVAARSRWRRCADHCCRQGSA